MILFCGYHTVGFNPEKMLALLKLVTCDSICSTVSVGNRVPPCYPPHVVIVWSWMAGAPVTSWTSWLSVNEWFGIAQCSWCSSQEGWLSKGCFKMVAINPKVGEVWFVSHRKSYKIADRSYAVRGISLPCWEVADGKTRILRFIDTQHVVHVNVLLPIFNKSLSLESKQRYIKTCSKNLCQWLLLPILLYVCRHYPGSVEHSCCHFWCQLDTSEVLDFQFCASEAFCRQALVWLWAVGDRTPSTWCLKVWSACPETFWEAMVVMCPTLTGAEAAVCSWRFFSSGQGLWTSWT